MYYYVAQVLWIFWQVICFVYSLDSLFINVSTVWILHYIINTFNITHLWSINSFISFCCLSFISMYRIKQLQTHQIRLSKLEPVAKNFINFEECLLKLYTQCLNCEKKTWIYAKFISVFNLTLSIKFSSSNIGPYILSPPVPSLLIMSPPWTIQYDTAGKINKHVNDSTDKLFTHNMNMTEQ